MSRLDEYGDPTDEQLQEWNEANDYVNEGNDYEDDEPEVDERWEQCLREHAEDQNPSLEDFYDYGY